MKLVAAIVLAAGVFVGGPALAQNTEAVAQARTAEDQWLALTDAGKFATSWEQASGYVKAAIDKPTWEKAMLAARAPLGSLKARNMKSAQFTTSLPGVPDGEYVVVQYETRFENKENALESVTAMKDKDGTWRVSGYYVK